MNPVKTLGRIYYAHDLEVRLKAPLLALALGFMSLAHLSTVVLFLMGSGVLFALRLIFNRVVAEEIRKLAESSAESAKTITKNLSQVLEAIRTMGSRIQNNGESFAFVHKESASVLQSLEEIASSMTEINQGNKEVLASIGEMTHQTKDVEKAIETLDVSQGAVVQEVHMLTDGVSEVTVGMKEIAQATEMIRTSMDSLQNMVIRLNSQSKELDQKIQKGR